MACLGALLRANPAISHSHSFAAHWGYHCPGSRLSCLSTAANLSGKLGKLNVFMLSDCGGGLVFRLTCSIVLSLKVATMNERLRVVQHVTDSTSIILGKVIWLFCDNVTCDRFCQSLNSLNWNLRWHMLPLAERSSSQACNSKIVNSSLSFFHSLS